jgi:glycosyltransferase involved in cell wall biosynthesis
MLRIVHLITGLGTGGAEMMLYKLLSRVDRSRFDSTVISLTYAGDIGPKISSLDVPVYELNIDGFSGGLSGLRKVIAILRTIRPHVIQTWLHHADLLGTIAAKLTGNYNLTWNLRCSSLSPDEFTCRHLLLVKVLGWLSPIPQVVVANSAAGRLAHINAGYHPQRWEVIPNGLDTSVFSPNIHERGHIREQLGANDSTALIGIVARYHPMKGHMLFLRAAKNLLESRPEVVFVLIGHNVDEHNQELADLINNFGISRNVRLIGERSDIPALMNALDILTCPSTSEGFPNVLVEAMACGVPCVATDVGDIRIIIGETGRVVPPGDASALAVAWSDVLALSPMARQRLGILARERILAFYDIDIIVERYQKLYEEIASEA